MRPAILSILALSTAVFAGAAAAQQPPPADAEAQIRPAPTPLETALEELQSEDAMVRRRGAYRLGDLRDPKGVAPLLRALEDENPFVRTGAVASLEKLRASGAAEKILTLLLKDDDAQVRQQAAGALSNLDAPEKIPALIKALDDKADGVRFAAARTLGSARAQAAAKRLAELLSSPEESAGMRRAAAGALRAIRSKDALEALEKALSDGDFYVRREAVQAVEAVGNPDSLVELRKRLGDEDAQVRVLAAQAMAKFGDLSGVAAALDLLAHPDPRVRQQAANVIGRVGSGKEAIAALKDALEKEPHPGVKNSLDFAIQRLEAAQKRNKQP